MISLSFLKPLNFISMVQDYYKPVVVVIDSMVVRSVECMIVAPGRAAEMLSRNCGRMYIRSFDIGLYVVVALTITPNRGEYVVHFTNRGVAQCDALRATGTANPDSKYLFEDAGDKRKAH